MIFACNTRYMYAAHMYAMPSKQRELTETPAQPNITAGQSRAFS
jgi:hypothetical protein